MNEQTNSSASDFASKNLINKIPRHDKDISWIKKKIGELEQRVGDNGAFANSFVMAQKNDKSIDNVLKSVIDDHDNHKIKVSALALGKWMGVLIIGGVIGALIKSLFP